MRLVSQLTSLRFYEALTAAGVLDDPGSVNRVVIDARRGELVVIRVETVAGDAVTAAAPALGALALVEDDDR